MATARLQGRPHGGVNMNINMNINVWRQWERFTQGGIRVNDKRYIGTQVFLVWFILLVGLLLLRVIVKRRKESGDDLADDANGLWKNRHLIFAMSAGRSGSKHLRNVLDCAENIRAFHEPNPAMNGNTLKEIFLQGHRKQTFESRANEKLIAIRRELEGTKPSVSYAETSHMFVKTFADVVLSRLGDVANITILDLNRPMSKVILSQLQLGWFTAHHSGLDSWYYNVFDIHSSEQVVHFNHSFISYQSQIDKLIAYNADVLQRRHNLRVEIERMQKKENRWKNVRVVDVSIDQLTAVDDIMRFFNQLNLEADQRRVELLSMQDDNRRQFKKDRADIHSAPDQVDNRLKQFVKHPDFSMLKSAM